MSGENLHEQFGVTAEHLDTWASEYKDPDWSHMRFGEETVHQLWQARRALASPGGKNALPRWVVGL